MSKVICKRADIVAIADAVRSKGNTTEAMTLGEIETAVYNIKSAGLNKIQRYIELQGNSAKYLFSYFGGTSIGDLIDGVDLSNVTSVSSMFSYCRALTTVPLFDTSNITNMNNMFNYCEALTSVPLFDTRNVTSMNYMFAGCKALTSVPSFDTRNVENMDYMFNYCEALTTVPLFDTRNVTSMNYMFNSCKALTECWLRNIKTNLQVGNGTSYGHLLTLESLLHLCKECRKTTSSLKLTVGTANLEKLANVYVKLIPITDDMRAEDDLIDEKYPFVQCQSTDADAMTIADYMSLKKWSLV